MRRAVCAFVVAVAGVWFVPGALASVTPSVTLNPTSVTAGSTGNLEVDIKFTAGSSTPSDTPMNLALALPPGLLANAAVNGGACLTSTALDSACQVGTGTVSIAPVAGIPLSAPIPVTFDLVAPPNPGDLAGLAIVVGDTKGLLPTDMQLGNTGGVVFDPSTGALDVEVTGIPNQLPLSPVPVSIQITEIDSTFDGLRMPTSCPSPPASVKVATVSYQDPTHVPTDQAPLTVNGCSALAFSPAFSLTAAKDASDPGVAITTDITQGADQATPKTVVLGFPSSVLSPNAAAVISGGILCANPASGTCKPVGSTSAASPLYPSTLNGQAYLTGSLTAPTISLLFPPPFALTLVGSVNLAANSTTFNNVPDIPLSDLKVSLAGGPNAVFSTTCSPSSGTATATLTSQNGDKTASPSSAFTVSGCSATGTGKGSGTGVGSATGSGGSGNGGPKSARPKLSAGSASGLTKGRPTLKFTVGVSRSAAKLVALSIKLPKGLSFSRSRVHKGSVTGLTLNGNGVKSAALRRGVLALALKRPVWSLTVGMGSKLLKESRALKKKANAKRHRLSSLKVSAGTDDANGERFAPSLVIRTLNLPKLEHKRS